MTMHVAPMNRNTNVTCIPLDRWSSKESPRARPKSMNDSGDDTIPKKPCRSVVDYNTEEDLRNALLGLDVNGKVSDVGRLENGEMDWVLTNYDKETTKPLILEEELERLQVLKGYGILDAERDIVFDRITDMAARIFHVPIALVSLVDVGRQVSVSSIGELCDATRCSCP